MLRRSFWSLQGIEILAPSDDGLGVDVWRCLEMRDEVCHEMSKRFRNLSHPGQLKKKGKKKQCLACDLSFHGDHITG